ncbi:MAG: hypothetical protein M5U28_14960 [Sandaracinaceae bacterium]|nr:hypothetical protein [Sandaracinaceae bacterium]
MLHRGSPSEADAAFDAAGTLHAIFLSSTWTSLEHASFDGTSVSEATLATCSGYCKPSSMVADATGTLHVCFVHSFTSVLRYARRPVGGPWSVEDVSTGATLAGDFCDIEVDGAGDVHVVHRNLDSVLYSRRAAGGAWTTEVVAAAHGSVTAPTGIAVSSGGAVHVAWMDYLGGPSDGHVHYATNAGGAWAEELAVTTSIGVTAALRGVDLLLDGAGTLHMAYAIGRWGGLHYGARSGGTWTFTSIHADGTYPALAAHGALLVIGFSTSTGVAADARPYVATSAGGAWTTERLFDDGFSLDEVTPVFDASGALHVVYTGAPDGFDSTVAAAYRVARDCSAP